MRWIDIKRRLYRDRRRLVFVTGMAAIAFFVVFRGIDLIVLGLPLPIFAALVGSVFVFSLELFVLRVIPHIRFSAEILAVTGTTAFFMIALCPPARQLALNEPSLMAILIALATFLLYQLVYGRWSDLVLSKVTQTDRATSVTSLDLETVWTSFIPIPGKPEFHYDRTVKEIVADPSDPDVIYMHHHFPSGWRMTRRVFIDYTEPLKFYKCLVSIEGARDGREVPQVITLIFEEYDGKVCVHMRITRSHMPRRKILMRWMDDYAGRVLDDILSRIEIQAEKHEAQAGRG
ncbi:MAG: hypothetical protein HUJ27_07140 [Rhodobacteraceae bacterium]|nr:hypothetical protein [Paracoccaceae bacterium]